MTTSSYASDFSLKQPIALLRQQMTRVGLSCGGSIVLGISQSQAIAAPSGMGCPVRPALERVQKHKVQPKETLTQIANRYGLLSTTLMGMNPSVRTGQVSPGQVLVIPPYNGILVSLTAGQTLQSAARAYRVKPDVLFEVNGCQKNPKTVFVPGVNWSPINAGSTVAASTQIDPLLRQDRYPLPKPAPVTRAYGWQPNGPRNAIVFSSGVDLATVAGAPVYAVTDGTVAFAGVQKPWGNMIVLNHARGRQTRYGYLGLLNVKVGQSVQRGQIIATVKATKAAPSSALRFELRYRSALGWVAQDPQPYLRAISGSKKPPQL
jgi:murein DD-endopeptidase MepM/ murein hydrolase activator NlpD